MWSLLIQTRLNVLIGFVVLLSLISTLSGCIGKTESSFSSPPPLSTNLEPVINVTIVGDHLTIPHTIDNQTLDIVVYEGELVTFDASDSFDPDGSITKVQWIVDYPDTIKEGISVTHTYHPFFTNGNMYITEIIVSITDSDGSITSSTFLLGVLRKQILYYLDINKLCLTTPQTTTISVKPRLNILKNSQTISFDCPKPIVLEPCTWNMSVQFSRPRLCFLQKITVALINEQGSVIDQSEWIQNLFSRWSEQSIVFKGTLATSQTLNKMTIAVRGFTLLKPLELSIGGSNPSTIQFDFT